MIGSPPPGTGYDVGAINTQSNQLLGQPSMANPAMNRPAPGGLFPGINGAVSKSPLQQQPGAGPAMQQQNGNVAAMVQALLQQQRG